MKRLVKVVAASAVALSIAHGASAQSTYGCENLDGFHSLPSVEGTEGVFYRVNPELRNFHPFSDETVEDVARLSSELQKFGTTLVYVPVPPKAMVMTENLPRRAYDYGFNPDLAATVYDDMIKRLRDAGVAVADARKALNQGSRGVGAPYFKTDYRINALGAQLIAQSVAEALAGRTQMAAPMARAPMPVMGAGQVELESDMRNVLQRHCLIDLPKDMVATVQPPQMQSATAPASGFGGSLGPRIALVGTEYSATPGVNFAGALQQATGMTVSQLSIPGGGAYGAFTAYVTSDEFQQSRPTVIVWETPVYYNLAQFGDQPMREIIAASGGGCRVPLMIQTGLEANTARAELAGLDPNVDYTLFLDTDGTAAGEARFTFYSAQGFKRTKTVTRADTAGRTGKFYMPLSGLWADGARYVDIELDQPFHGTPRLAACFY